jgi:uncharacterized protein (TIGR02118 family)
MAEKIYWKILLLMKRKPGTSMEEFRNYYENNHVPLCAPYMQGIARYFRRYLCPQPHAESGTNEELPYDVVTEMWFDNEENFTGTLGYITATVMPDVVVEDEAKFFHRPTMRIATVVECETTMSPEGTPVL